MDRTEKVSKLEDYQANASQAQINATIKRNFDLVWRRLNNIENRLETLENKE